MITCSNAHRLLSLCTKIFFFILGFQDFFSGILVCKNFFGFPPPLLDRFLLLRNWRPWTKQRILWKSLPPTVEYGPLHWPITARVLSKSYNKMSYKDVSKLVWKPWMRGGLITGIIFSLVDSCNYNRRGFIRRGAYIGGSLRYTLLHEIFATRL